MEEGPGAAHNYSKRHNLSLAHGVVNGREAANILSGRPKPRGYVGSCRRCGVCAIEICFLTTLAAQAGGGRAEPPPAPEPVGEVSAMLGVIAMVRSYHPAPAAAPAVPVTKSRGRETE